MLYYLIYLAWRDGWMTPYFLHAGIILYKMARYLQYFILRGNIADIAYSLFNQSINQPINQKD